MRPGHLSLVDAPADVAGLPADSPEAEAEMLKARARILARDQLASVQRLLGHLTEMSAAASRGDLPLGVRELCRQISDETKFRAQTLGAVIERTMPAAG